MIDKKTKALLVYFLRTYPRRTLYMIGLMILSGLAEGVGLFALLPLLNLAVAPGAAESGASAQITGALRAVGIEPTLAALLLLIVAAMLIKGVLIWLASRQVGYTVAQVGTDLRLKLIRALMKAQWGFFSKTPTGHFTNAISGEAGQAAVAYRQSCALAANLVQVVIYLTVVFTVSWQGALVAVAVGSLTALALRRFVEMSRAAGLAQWHVMTSLVARLTDAVPGIKPIKAMGREQQLLPLLEQETEEVRLAQQKLVFASESQKAFQEPILVVVIAIGLYGAMTVGNQPFTAILVLAVLFYRLMQTAGHIQAQYQDVAACEAGFSSVLRHISNAESAREVPTGTKPPPQLRKGIRLQRVSFRYAEQPVLSRVSVLFPAGKFIAIVGQSGAGKTTLVDLMIGLIRPQEGTIFLDDTPLLDVDTASWRGLIGYVPQEILLFHGSVFHNVTLGDYSVSREDVREALVGAGAWEFVSQLPNGMDELIGERGSRLSGGQRQRLAIARALVGKPKLVILDEGTAALDRQTEEAVRDSLRQLDESITVVAISHHTAMSEIADVTFHVSDGEIREIPRENTVGSRLEAAGYREVVSDSLSSSK